MVPLPPAPHRLLIDADALVSNWRWLRDRGGSAECGACVKADGYGLGAVGVADRLVRAGCPQLYVSTWAEAAALPQFDGVGVSVFHGVQPGEEAFALAHHARPVLCSPEQVRRWRGSGQPCDVMVDTGMNRLGVSPRDVANGLLDGLKIDTLMSHLVAADTDSPLSERQRCDFAAFAGRTTARRMSLANSAGVVLGPDYAFDLTRPGLALYGGRPRAEARMKPVVSLQARVVQTRIASAGETVGYNALWRAPEDTPLAIVNLGYADGFARAWTNRGEVDGPDGEALPIVGRVSMDLMAVDTTRTPSLREGDWVSVGLDLVKAGRATGRSQYEVLTGLGQRLERHWS